MTLKQWEIKFKPGIKLNHNIYKTMIDLLPHTKDLHQYIK